MRDRVKVGALRFQESLFPLTNLCRETRLLNVRKGSRPAGGDMTPMKCSPSEAGARLGAKEALSAR